MAIIGEKNLHKRMANGCLRELFIDLKMKKYARKQGEMKEHISRDKVPPRRH